MRCSEPPPIRGRRSLEFDRRRGRACHAACEPPAPRQASLAHSHNDHPTTPPPLPASAENRTKLHRELCIFFIFLGVLLAIPAYLTLSGISGTPPLLWGVPRHLAIGVPTAILSALHLLAGILLAIVRSRLFAIVGGVASTLITVFYFVFMFSATGTIPINLISIVVVAIPIVVWSRVGKFLSTASNAK